MILETIPIGMFQSNAYIVGDETTRACAIIDSGEDGRGIEAAVHRLGLTPQMLLVTHGHLDHVGGLARLRRAFPGVPVVGSAADRSFFETAAQQGLMFGVRVEAPPPIDRELSDGEIVRIGSLELRTIFTPGHSPGGVSFHCEAEKAVFVGDALFAGSIGRTDLPGGDYGTLIASIRSRLFPLGDDVVVYSGHGPETTIGDERETNPFLAE